MKVRHSFVSNSSSSSFVLVVSVKHHVAALNKLDSEDQATMQLVLGGIKPTKVAGVKVIVIDGGDYEDTWSRGSMYDDDCPALRGLEGDEYYRAWKKATEFWDHYIEELPSDEIIYHWTDN